MKLSQSSTQITIKQSGVGQVVIGILFIAIGLVVTVTSLAKDAEMLVPIIGVVFAVVGGLVAFFAKNVTTTIVKGGDFLVTQKRVLSGGLSA